MDSEYVFESEKATKLLLKNYDLVKTSGVSFIDKRIRFLIARLFAGNNDVINPEKFNEINKEIKRQLGFFTALNGNVRASLAGLLMANDNASSESISQVISNYNTLIDAGFKRTEYTYFAAYLLLEATEPAKVARKAKIIHELFKKDHPFLTKSEDVTTAVFLANLPEEDTAKLASITEYYFQAFANKGFRKNDSLQFLATTGTLLYGEENSGFIRKVDNVVEELRRKGVKIKPLHYSSIGILAFVMDGRKIDSGLVNLIDELSQQPGLKFGREFVVALAISMYTEKQSGQMSKEQLEGLMVNVHILIAMEQAAAASAAAGASAAAASN
ncbi:DUF4003 family protein [Listeria ivanovii]|uniref:DUF4003 domain-containing protein n=1 Tax=Listeria ivanovii (strain ATCC BAA-678 / PAM 55) TaxID=881621 RepID=G2Z8I2_LISIP|nr:DUF4003 family protein [Listeria ivanovii]AHI57068.1 hypothetical protein AX25_13680 [Listeria ivanovii WSLC3009]MBK3914960.1 DUF4003 domain-containing protein [Listeria ivanovii subsp. ivanovii]MBK3921879.1 DUF4003 domain-containing protein [Listeria ivanovii subsp. ivanovii]MBK3927248.1 DUF4003 domain-containing protein [Listeria ivanovii subsp. ivanovii]MCJ1722978.1 DUF4003 domain-containing protein [Listeria ivanovii]